MSETTRFHVTRTSCSEAQPVPEATELPAPDSLSLPKWIADLTAAQVLEIARREKNVILSRIDDERERAFYEGAEFRLEVYDDWRE
jgi:hypothetical protein